MIYRNGNNNFQREYGPISVRDDKNVNLEISYDNFDTVNLEMEKKAQYAQDLRSQIEENKRRRQAALEKKRLEDIEEELRLKRERELIEQRQNAENRRYRPQVNLPLITNIVEEPKKSRKRIIIENNFAPQEVNTQYIINRNDILNESELNYLRSRQNEIDNYNNMLLDNLNLLNKDFENSINSLKGEIGMLNDMNQKNKKYKDLLCWEVNNIKQDLDNKKKQDGIDSKNLSSLISSSDFTKQIVGNLNSFKSLPNRRYELKKYNNKNGEDESRFFIDDEKKSDGLGLSPYVNLSHVISYKLPKWKSVDEDWFSK